MGQKIFLWRPLKTRVTLITLVTFVISIWAVALYPTFQEPVIR